ncbi:WW domain-containing protein [Caerostris extrusa]|uniref:WW domain-containing protein n=1 Tax=Caerostris extrusa TaxID=172846 RepID=A0AAV4VMT8_CAEEX|nr:WW domain-containing protein [Caerostris extrusa]
MAKTEILVEDPSSDYKISENDLYVYAKQIGIDILNEKHLMWIAEEGLSANVPEPWLILSDSKNRIFYIVQERKKFLNSPLSDCGFESKLSSLSDAPPLSSSGKTTPSSLKPVSNSNTLSERKPELGHFENRRGAKLAP